jgi:hypothetical protein
MPRTAASPRVVLSMKVILWGVGEMRMGAEKRTYRYMTAREGHEGRDGEIALERTAHEGHDVPVDLAPGSKV